MARLEGYECNTCKKWNLGSFYGACSPNGWYTVRGVDRVFHFCSRECLEKWVGAGSVPESKRVLFAKLLKAMVGV